MCLCPPRVRRRVQSDFDKGARTRTTSSAFVRSARSLRMCTVCVRASAAPMIISCRACTPCANRADNIRPGVGPVSGVAGGRCFSATVTIVFIRVELYGRTECVRFQYGYQRCPSTVNVSRQELFNEGSDLLTASFYLSEQSLRTDFY